MLRHFGSARVRVFLSAVLVLCFSIARCQDISNLTQFFINPYTLNPSYAGTEGRLALFAGYRKQWASIAGAPTVSIFSAHAPIGEKLAAGLTIVNDQRGIVRTSAVSTTFGYHVKIDQFSSVRFGLSLGVGFNSVDFGSANVGTVGDPVVTKLLNSNSTLLGNAGISYQKKTFNIGLAIPNLFEPIYLTDNAFAISALQPFQSVIINASNRFYFANDQHVFEPYVIYRFNQGVPSQVEVAGLLHLNHLVWLGGSYKQQLGVSALGGFKIKNQFAVGFAYGFQNAGSNQIPSPSYEVQIGYLMGEKQKRIEAYSFVDTHKNKVSRKNNAVANKNQKKPAPVKKPATVASAKPAPKKPTESPKSVAPAGNQNVTQPVVPSTPAKPAEQKATPSPVRKDTLRGGPRYKKAVDLIDQNKPLPAEQQHAEEQEKLARLAQHEDDPTEHHDNSVEHPHAERHEFVEKGGHHEEIDYGDYVVVGVFKSRENSEHFSKELNKLKFTTDFGYLTVKGFWYVYLEKSYDINQARADRDKFRKMKIFRDAWLLTVQ